MADETHNRLATSTGSDFSESAHLDRHFAACQPEYEAMLKSVGLKPGWHMLDAGTGSGSFLPLMSQLLGSSGQIQAVDLAPENVVLVEAKEKQNHYNCPVTVRVATVTDLPFADDSFDAVWCAAITQYLSDNELDTTLQEFRRVLKPGGLLALKDASLMCMQWQPQDPLLLARSYQAAISAGNAYAAQTLRSAVLPTWVRHAGYEIIKANTIMIERWQPLRPVEKAFISGLMMYLADGSTMNNYVSESDRLLWQKVADTGSPEHVLNHPDFYYREGHVMIIAKNPPPG